MSNATKKTCTIILTDRPPVNIHEETWPLIASVAEKDGICRRFVGVRKHADGRAIIYATYSLDSNWPGAREHSAKRGVLLPEGPTDEAICAAIHDVCKDISGAECNGEDRRRWPRLAAFCVGNMPAEELA
jgi:hypothetical protein